MPSLRSRLASGVRWTVSIRVVERVIGFASTLILVRLLVPADFGVVAMGTAIQEILVGITASVLHKRLSVCRGTITMRIRRLSRSMQLRVLQSL